MAMREKVGAMHALGKTSILSEYPLLVLLMRCVFCRRRPAAGSLNSPGCALFGREFATKP